MGLDYFNIELDNATAIFLAGDIITGKLNYKVREPIKFKKVIITAIGKGHVSWSETRITNDPTTNETQTETVNYYGSEKHYGFQVVFDSDANGAHLQPGTYSKSFRFNLPNNVPTSFEHSNGAIKHIIEGIIEIPWSKDKKCTKLITVIGPVDLNHFPILAEPSSVTRTKTFCCLCFKSDPVNIRFTVRQGGCVAGQKIKCDARVDNQSSKTLDIIKVCLIELCTFNASSKSKTETRTICQFDLRHVQPRTLEDFSSIEISVPPVCPTTMNSSSRVLIVNYYVQLVVGAKGFSANAYCNIPITIGTIPIQTGKITRESIHSYKPSYFRGSEGVRHHYPYFKDVTI